MTNAVSDKIVGREGKQRFDDVFETPKQFVIAPLGFVKRPGLFLKYMKDRIGTVAAFNLRGEWVVAEIFPSLLCVLLQGSIEKSLEGGGHEGWRCQTF